jgi:hypothetical protein
MRIPVLLRKSGRLGKLRRFEEDVIYVKYAVYGAGLRWRRWPVFIAGRSPRTDGLLYQGRQQPALRLSRRFYDADGRMLTLAIGRRTTPGAAFVVTRQCDAGELAS